MQLHVYGFKYSHLIQIIFEKIYLNYWLNPEKSYHSGSEWTW